MSLALRVLPLIVITLILPYILHADTKKWSKTINNVMSSHVRDLRFPDGSKPVLASHTGHSEYRNTVVSVQYHTRVIDVATGAVVLPGSTVSQSTQLSLEFVPHTYSDIEWFTAWSWYGSPYGEWHAGPYPPPIQCSAKDLLVDDGYGKSYFVFFVEPPQKTLTSPAGVSCATGSGSNKLCTFSQAGTYNFRFVFAPTKGRFYVRVIEPKTAGRCAGSIKATSISGGAPEQEYVLPVPMQTFDFPINVVADNGTTNAPSTPTLSIPSISSCVVGRSATISMSATDSDNDDLRFLVDWNDDGLTDQIVPSSGYVSSGSTQSANRIFASAGSKTVRVRAQDKGGMLSKWATLTFSCAPNPDGADEGALDELPDLDPDQGLSAPPVADLSLRAIPSLVRNGNTTKINWSATGVASCTVTAPNGDSWVGLESPVGGETSSPITAQTVYTLRCQSSQGVQTKTATVNVLPVWREQ